MKKLLFFLAALMFVASCAKDATTTPEVKGEKVVSFKVTSPKMQTRYGEGAEANKLFWAVYKDGQRLDNVSVIDPAEAVAINMSADVEITLMEGIDYDILFWAQNEDAPYTFDGEKVTIGYNTLSANKEAYDAFFRNYHVDADQTEPHRVELRRPFAQLNIGTADTAKAQSAGFTVDKTSITVETCTVLDLATGEASEPQEITFEMNTKANDTYGEAPDTFDIISMNYLLVNNDKVMTTVTLNAEGGNDLLEREYLNVPLQRNHRTYILGDILTSSKLFNVYINPAFINPALDDEDYIYDPNDKFAGITPEPNVIYYTSTDGKIIDPSVSEMFGTSQAFTSVNMISNTYENGIGKIVCDGPIDELGFEAFVYSTRLLNIVLPSALECISDSAFAYCASLTSITIPESVVDIFGFAFDYCSSLTSVTSDVFNSSNSIFSKCANLEEFNSQYATPDKRCVIIDNALLEFAPAGLNTYAIPEGVTKIVNGTFHECKELTSIAIPSSLIRVDGHAFAECSNLQRVDITDLSAWCKINFDPWCFGTNPLFYAKRLYLNGTEVTDLIIPSDVTEVKNFSYCESLKSVTFHDKVATIGGFDHCTELTDVNIQNGVTEIGREAFANCSSLTDVTIPGSVRTIGDLAFQSCSSLSSVTINDGVTTIGGSAFFNCNNLSTVYCKSTTPPQAFGSGMCIFGNDNTKITIYVPTASVDAYKNADGWSYYADRIVDGEF